MLVNGVPQARQRLGPESCAYAAEVARYLIAMYGVDAFLQLYRWFGRLPAAQARARMLRHFALSYAVSAAVANPSRKVTAEALDALFGLTVDALDELVKDGLRL